MPTLRGAHARFLQQHEATESGNAPNRPLVVEPDGDDSLASWIATLADNADTISDALSTFGAVLLRARCINAPEQFARLTAALGFAKVNAYPFFTDNHRKSISPGVIEASSTPPKYPVPPHTEQAFNRRRPGVIGFACLQEPAAGGETPLHDCVAAYAALLPEIRDLLDRTYFCKSTRRMTEAAIRANFDTLDRPQIEQICSAFQVPFSWEGDGLSLTTKGPCVVVHPRTGERCLSCFWTLGSHYIFYRKFPRAPGVSKWATALAKSIPFGVLEWSLQRCHPLFRNDYIYSFETDGQAARIPSALQLELNEAVWRHTTIFSWRRGDVLLIDNIKMAHSRMPYLPPRQICAAVFNYYDSAELAVGACRRDGEATARVPEEINHAS